MTIMTSMKHLNMGGFLKWWYPKMDGFIMKNPIKMDDLGVLPFKETPIYLLILGPALYSNG